MAEKIVDLVGKKSGKQWRKCKTKNFSISGGEFKDEAEFQQSRKNFLSQATDYEIDSSVIEQWFYRYGKNTAVLLAIHKSLKENGHNHAEELAEVQYCVTHEMAVHPNDYFIRRTGKIFFEKPAAEQHLNTVTQSLANQFNWNETVRQQYLSEVKNEFEAITHFV
jgi:glycerol-3-phosphate dehydrogenase